MRWSKKKPPVHSILRPALRFHAHNSEMTALVLYLLLNLGLTFLNKIALQAFPFPYLLTAIHSGFSYIGSQILLSQDMLAPSRSTLSRSWRFLAFSLLYTVNIIVSNISLGQVTIPFHQIIRATTPLWTVLIYRFAFGVRYKYITYLSLITVVAGVGLATAGDYSTTIKGFVLTTLGAILAAIKTVVTNHFQGPDGGITALELLHKMSPYAMTQSLIYACVAGELYHFYNFLMVEENISLHLLVVLLGSGLVAFALNLVSFTANRAVGALAITVAANIKQIASIILSMLFFKVRIGKLHLFGIFVTLSGGWFYSRVELQGAVQVKPQEELDVLEKGVANEQQQKR